MPSIVGRSPEITLSALPTKICPNDIALQCAEDMSKKKLWYVRWLASGKSYVDARAWASSEEKSKLSHSDGDMWMTEGQILNHFKCPLSLQR